MAKAEPSLLLEEMERKLGFSIDSDNYPTERAMRFYSDLRPIPKSTIGKVKEEYEEYEKWLRRTDFATACQGIESPPESVITSQEFGELHGVGVSHVSMLTAPIMKLTRP